MKSLFGKVLSPEKTSEASQPSPNVFFDAKSEPEPEPEVEAQITGPHDAQPLNLRDKAAIAAWGRF